MTKTEILHDLVANCEKRYKQTDIQIGKFNAN